MRKLNKSELKRVYGGTGSQSANSETSDGTDVDTSHGTDDNSAT